MNKRPWYPALLIIFGLSAISCDLLLPAAPPDEEILDGPVDGLTTAQMALFLRGDEEFNRIRTFEEGIGPIFNAPSCGTCHPGEGRGHPEFGFVRFGKYDEHGNFDPMTYAGGPQIQDRAMPGYEPETLSADASGFATLIAPSITGLGLLEAVDDKTLLALADPDDLDGDGISGRVHFVDATEQLHEMARFADHGKNQRFKEHNGKMIGRFGWKGAQTSLLHQTVMAFHQDLGMTSYFEMFDNYNHAIGAGALGLSGDPELPSDELFAVTFYLRTLRPPIRRNTDHPDVIAGEKIFEEIGCASCHVPSLPIGEVDIAALADIGEARAYTDLLLHDMGPELDDGYTEGDANSNEWRTPPLWGIGLAPEFQGGRGYYLHDGRATTLREAIGFHGGEAATSRSNFNQLSTAEQTQLLRFLESL